MDHLLVTENYRDRWSVLPEGECDLYEGETVQLIHRPAFGPVHVRRVSDGRDVYVAGFSAHMLKDMPESAAAMQ